MVIIDQEPLAQINVFADAIFLTRRSGDGRWRSYPVSTEGFVEAFSQLPIASGLLPPNTLATGLKHGRRFYVIYVPPRQALIPFSDGRHERVYAIQTPPLVWGACENDYRVWAFNQVGFPGDDRLPLCHAPFPNCYLRTGAICWGNTGAPPRVAPGNLEAVLKLFLEGSQFNTHLANGKSRSWPANVVALYKRLSPETPYPLNDLVSADQRLGWVLAGGPWEGYQ